MDPFASLGELITRLLVSVALGAILGWERELNRKPAGLRTHVMVSLGSASFTLFMMDLSKFFVESSGPTNVDPTRIVEAIVGGIGFLGAGSIIQSRGSVEGVTTAATIWVAGAIGLACGAGYYVLASFTTVIAFIVLAALGYLEKILFHDKPAPAVSSGEEEPQKK